MLRFALAVLLGCALVSAQRPNVVLIVADDMAFDDFGFMGNGEGLTPRIDRLAEEGVVFERGYVPTALCRPSLMTLTTGLYPHQHGVTGNDPPKGAAREEMLRRIDALDTLPKLLASHGYRCMQTGKWWEGGFRRGGFTEGMTHGDPQKGGRHGDDGLRIGRETMEPIESFVTACAEDKTPFFLWYAPMLPHQPHDAPERLLQHFRKEGRPESVARYLACCAWFDETCGVVFDLIERRGLEDDTLVILVSDNGWRQDPAREGFTARSKRSPYEGGVRTPIVLRGAGFAKSGGQRRSDLVSTIDIAPTVLRACGIEVPASWPGIDLCAVAAGAKPDRAGVFGASFGHDLVDLADPRRNLLRRFTVQGRWKWIEGEGAGSGELFDVIADPLETQDLAAEHPKEARSLAASVDRWWPARTRDKQPNILFVLTDDQRADELACAGHPFLQTPQMDGLAARGTRFANAFVTTPICAASRATFLCGAYEATHHFTFGTPSLAAPFVEQAWPGLLRAAGYRTGFVGKWGVKNEDGATAHLWDRFVPLSPPYLRTDAEGHTRHLTDITADRALEFLREGEPGRPFCLMVSFNAPHAEDDDPAQYIPPPAQSRLYDRVAIPEVPSEDGEDLFDRSPAFEQRSMNRIRWRWRFDAPDKRARMVRAQAAMVTGIDLALGRLLTELAARGLADDTVVIFASDNGCFLGERGFAGKWTIHEESIRVPLIVCDPRIAWPRGRVMPQLALNVDVPPTILELAGVAVPDGYQGTSLVPLLRGESPPWRHDFFVEHRFDHPDIPKFEGVRDEHFAYARNYEQDPVWEELYDLATDPHERHNLATDPGQTEVLLRMRARCAELRAQLWR